MATTLRSYRNLIWPEKKVRFTTENFLYPKKIRDAIALWSQTGIDFEEVVSENMSPSESYLTFHLDSTSMSQTVIGYRKARKIQVEVSSSNPNVLFVLLHEIGHALGLLHEHQRVKRDEYIIINEDNCDPAWKQSFIENVKTINGDCVECIGISNPNNSFYYYDFKSIMHYDKYMFADKNNPRPTIQIKHPPDSHIEEDMGKKAELSIYDIKGVKHMYDI